MYLISDTVEEAIYELSVTRRLALMQSAALAQHRSGAATPDPAKAQESALETANSLELQSAPMSKLLTKGQDGGEMVETDDLWRCLFSRPRAKQSDLLSHSTGDGPASRELGAFLRAEAAEIRGQEGSD